MTRQLLSGAIVLGTFWLGFDAALAGAEVHRVFPATHSRLFMAGASPVARIRSGDTVITRTWDAGGQDHENVWHLRHPYVYPETGNPLMGPFYVEGAEYGDTLEVRLDRLRLNRSHGYTGYQVNPAWLPPGDRPYDPNYGMDAVRKGRATLIPWDIDLDRGTATPRLRPDTRSDWTLALPVRPMLGCIGVAPARGTVETSETANEHGGNMDYNDVVEGATVFFPVFAEGAYLYVGDGHALQGDGEGLGSGIETTLDVQFTVRLHKARPLAVPRLVNDTHLVSIASQAGFRSSLDIGIRTANGDMARWLTSECGLTAQEAHMLLGTVAAHKIVTYSGTVATLMRKDVLPPRCHVLFGPR
jgi:acetamidase/formamidase